MRIHNQCDVALGRVGQQKLHAGEPTKRGTRANFGALPWLNLDGPRVKQGRHKPPAEKTTPTRSPRLKNKPKRHIALCRPPGNYCQSILQARSKQVRSTRGRLVVDRKMALLTRWPDQPALLKPCRMAIAASSQASKDNMHSSNRANRPARKQWTKPGWELHCGGRTQGLGFIDQEIGATCKRKSSHVTHCPKSHKSKGTL